MARYAFARNALILATLLYCFAVGIQAAGDALVTLYKKLNAIAKELDPYCMHEGIGCPHHTLTSHLFRGV